MINKIGIENFRIFKDYTEFEIKPITLLTGPNNSGKSSFTKLLLLLQKGVNNLNFETGKHNLESFEKVLSWGREAQEMMICLENIIPILGNDILTEIIYKKGKISNINLLKQEEYLLKFSFGKNVKEEDDFNTIRETQNFYLNINLLIQEILSFNVCVRHSKQIPSSGNWMSVWTELKNVDRSRDKTNSLKLAGLKEMYDESLKKGYYSELDFVRNIALYNEINSLEDRELLYKIKVGEKDVSHLYKKEILDLQDKFFSMETNIMSGPELSSDEPFQFLSHLIKIVPTKAKFNLKEFFSKELQNPDVTVEYSPLGKLIFEEKIFNDAIEESEFYSDSIYDLFQSLKWGYNAAFKDLHYLSANRGNQKRVLHNISDSDIDEIILKFSKLKSKNLPFLQEALSILEVSGNLKVERFQNYISVVYVELDDKKISLADLGYGYSQVIPIILRIICEMQKDLSFDLPAMGFPLPMTFIIEEPEANLHPNLQSKLADVLALSLKYYPEIKFIIETHSEYLIRKLQYLTAKQELTPDQCVIYYFNSDKYVSKDEPKVKKIMITPTGNLTDTFGPGFYDEATRLKFNLMKINQEQSN